MTGGEKLDLNFKRLAAIVGQMALMLVKQKISRSVLLAASEELSEISKSIKSICEG